MIIKRRRPDLYKGSSAEWRLGGVEVLPVIGCVCALVGASAIFLLFYFADNLGLAKTKETAVYLIGHVRPRGGVVDGRRGRCVAGRASTWTSSTRRFPPTDAAAVLPQVQGGAPTLSGCASSPTSTARNGVSRSSSTPAASTTSATSSSGVTSQGRRWCRSSAPAPAGALTYGDHSYDDLSERERIDAGTADPRQRAVPGDRRAGRARGALLGEAARPDLRDGRARQHPPLGGAGRGTARRHRDPLLRDSGKRRLLGDRRRPRSSDVVEYVEGRCVRLDERREMVTTGYSNITPWTLAARAGGGRAARRTWRRCTPTSRIRRI